MKNLPIIGHNNVVNFLKNSLAKNTLAHAYLFSGPQNTGKTTVAWNFVQSVLCQSNQDKPCNNCLACKQFCKQSHPDFFLVKREIGKKNISIDQVRELKHKINLTSFLNSYKIVIIQKAEFLNIESANALLKTIEEAPAKTIIILITSRQNSLPQTVLSRCQIIKFGLSGQSEVLNFIRNQNEDHEKSIIIAKLSQGKIGLAMRYLKNPDLLLEHQGFVQDFLNICDKNLSEKFKIIASYLSAKKNDPELIHNILTIWLTLVRDIILLKNNKPDLVINWQYRKELTDLTVKYNSRKLAVLLKQLFQAKIYVGQNVNAQLILENIVIHL